MLISFHLPKAAGKSFYQSLLDHYGNSIISDYLDYPMNTYPILRKNKALIDSIKNRYVNMDNVECIHGHFLPLKYRYLKDKNHLNFITWMRNPAERIASQYYYMKRNYTPEIGKTQRLYKRIIEEDWSLEKYCLSNEFKNTCAQMLWGFPVKKFDFIGIVEDYDNDLDYFSNKYLNKRLKGYKKNCNPSIQQKSYYTDEDLKSKVTEFHAKDLELYQYALQLKETRS